MQLSFSFSTNKDIYDVRNFIVHNGNRSIFDFITSSFLLNNNKNAVDIIRNLSWCVTNLKGNLDLVLEELSHGNEAEQQSARQIKEKIHRYTLEDLQKSGQFNEKI